MTHIYSNQLVAYLFDELDPDSKQKITDALTQNKELMQEFNDLKKGLGVLLKEKPLSPSKECIQNILDATEEAEAIH